MTILVLLGSRNACCVTATVILIKASARLVSIAVPRTTVSDAVWFGQPMLFVGFPRLQACKLRVFGGLT